MLRYGLGYYSANKPTMDLFRHTRGGSAAALRWPPAAGRRSSWWVRATSARWEGTGGGDRHSGANRKSFAVMVTDSEVESCSAPVPLLAGAFLQLEPLYH